MSPALISQDGRWWWDGRVWRSRLVEGELDLFWFTTTPEWFERVLLTGLIALIPIVGQINLYGWTLEATDMVRRRWRELPPAGFQYLERGVAPFVVFLVYGLVAFFVIVSIAIGIVASLLTRRAEVVIPTIAVLLFFALCFAIAWWLITLYLFAAALIGADRLGIARALDPRTLFHLARKNHPVSLAVALTYGVASLALGAAGSVIPFGGLLIAVALPAVYATFVPKLARFEVDAEPVAQAG